MIFSYNHIHSAMSSRRLIRQATWVYFIKVNRGVDNGVLGHRQASVLDQSLHLCERSGNLYMGFYGDDLTGPLVTAGQWYHAVWQYVCAL